MNFTNDQLIDIAYIAATYLAVGAFSISIYSMFHNRKQTSAMNATSDSTGSVTESSELPNQMPMSFVKFSELPSTAESKTHTPAKVTATRPVTNSEREAVLNVVRQRLREVSPAERLADAMSRK